MTLCLTNRSLKKRSSSSASSSTTTIRSRSFSSIRWSNCIVTILVVIVALINLSHGFKTINGESRKLFGGYRITPKHCRATKTLPSSDPRAKGPTICMFNHECAQRNGEVVGACMDGFLFGACCQVPNNQQPENTLINDAQNTYYHQYQNQKLQQQETETNKIVSQAYETFAENSAQQQSLESSQTQDSGYGGASLSSLYNVDRLDSHQQDTSEQSSTSAGASTEHVASSVSIETDAITQASLETQTNSPREPPKIKVNKDSVKITSPSQSPQNDDFVLQVLNTMPPGEGNHHIVFTTEIPNKIASSLTEQTSSESNSFEEEHSTVTNKPLVKKPSNQHKETVQQQHHHHHHSETVQHQTPNVVDVQEPSESQQHNEIVQHDADQLFGGVTFTHSDITHPGADADLIEDDLQFSTGYGPQPVFVPAPVKNIETYGGQEANKHTTNVYDATTSSSSITTHVDSIETIIQQLNNNNSNPGPAYNVINHHDQPQHQTSNYDSDLVTVTKRPSVAYDEQDNTKHTSLASLSYNEVEHNDKQNAVSGYGQISSSTSSLSSSSAANEATTVNAVYSDEFVLEDHTMPELNYNDYQASASKHPTSDFNKMPAIGIAYPVDMSYMEEGANLEAGDSAQASYTNIITQQHTKPQQQQQNVQSSYSDNKHQQQQQQTAQVSHKHQQQQQQQNTQVSHKHQQQQTTQVNHKHQQQQTIQVSHKHQQQQQQTAQVSHKHQQQQQQQSTQVNHKHQQNTQTIYQNNEQHHNNKYQQQQTSSSVIHKQQQTVQQHHNQQQQQQTVQASYSSQTNQQQQQQLQSVQGSYVNTEQHQLPQPIIQDSYASQSEEEKISEVLPTAQNYVAESHQRPIASYIGVVTAQSYDTKPLPNEVVVSSYTTKVEENAEVSTEYKPIITTNRITSTSHRTTTKPVKQTSSTTSQTNRPTLVTKRPVTKKPTKPSSQRPTTNSYATTNSITTQQYFSTTPIETKTPSPAEPLYARPTVQYDQGVQQDYIISSGSTPKPLVTRKPTKKQTAKPASTSYITGPTTPRPPVTPQFQYDQEVPLIQADDKLDSFVHSTAESLAAATPTQETLSYDPPVFISGGGGGSQVNSQQRPQYNTHKKPGFVKVQATQRPPSPTVLITPKPTSLQTTASSFTSPQYTTPMAGYGSTSFVYNNLVTRRPDLGDNSAGDYVGISTVNSNDFDDPGYYGSGAGKPARPAYVSASTEPVYPVPTDDKPAFPGYYGPTPVYPAFQVPGEKLDSPIDEAVYTSPNDFINFPPVRNPNLNMSATSSAVTSDLELSTPAFVEDSVLKNKMNTLVHKIVESLQGNFEALADMIDENNNTAPVQTYQASPAGSTVTKKPPTRKPQVTRITTVKPKATTKKPITRVSTKAPTKKPVTTRKPETTTKRPVVRRTTTTTRRPATKKPTRKATTTTQAPAEDELVDEEDEEDVNPSDNEITEDEETYGASASGRKIQCGMRPHVKSGRIVGGKGATFGAYPWQVLVRESTWLGLFTKNKCGGVLITNRYVITAAHCQPGFLASLVAVMGEFDISGDLESKRAVTKNVKRVIVHRQYDPATFENDIALLELESPVQFDTHIVPICMPSDFADFTGRMATVTGWGRLKYGGGVPSVLQEVQVPVIENSVCQEMFHTAGHNKKILNSFLCAGYANGQKDSCEGDSGGPLVLQRPDGRYELAGTVSHGIKCAAPYLPGVYMRTTYYKPWLRSITGVK